jgi:hypothetical protein
MSFLLIEHDFLNTVYNHRFSLSMQSVTDLLLQLQMKGAAPHDASGENPHHLSFNVRDRVPSELSSRFDYREDGPARILDGYTEEKMPLTLHSRK